LHVDHVDAMISIKNMLLNKITQSHQNLHSEPRLTSMAC
jgi:hypothetical protein